MREPFMLVCHQSKCINVIKRIPLYYFHVCILGFIHVFVYSLIIIAMYA